MGRRGGQLLAHAVAALRHADRPNLRPVARKGAGARRGEGFVRAPERDRTGLRVGLPVAKRLHRDVQTDNWAHARDVLQGPIAGKAHRVNHYGYSARVLDRSEEHKSELPSLMRISYAVFCL